MKNILHTSIFFYIEKEYENYHTLFIHHLSAKYLQLFWQKSWEIWGKSESNLTLLVLKIKLMIGIFNDKKRTTTISFLFLDRSFTKSNQKSWRMFLDFSLYPRNDVGCFVSINTVFHCNFVFVFFFFWSCFTMRDLGNYWVLIPYFFRKLGKKHFF